MTERSGVTARALWTVGLGAAVVSYGLARLWFRRSGGLPDPSWPAALVLVLITVLLVVAGRRIAATRAGTATRPLHPIGIYRTLVGAQACALTGALVAGGYLAFAAVLWPDVDFPSVRADVAAALAVAVAGGLLVGAGMWVQKVCRVDSGDHPTDDTSAPSG